LFGFVGRFVPACGYKGFLGVYDQWLVISGINFLKVT